MSPIDHEWTKEQMAAHLAGGLSAEERARLEAHVAACAECIADLDALRRFERRMDEVLAPARPGPDLEDRVVAAVREIPERAPVSPFRRLLMGMAAVFMFGGVGLVIMQAEGSADLPFPGIMAVRSAPADGEEAALYAKLDDASGRPSYHRKGSGELAAPARSHAPAPAAVPAPEPAVVALIEGDKDARELQRDENRKTDMLARQQGPQSGERVLRFRADGPAARNEYFKPNESLAKLGDMDRAADKLKELDPGAEKEQLQTKGESGGRRMTVTRGGGAGAPGAANAAQAGQGGAQQDPAPAVQRKIIRSGEVEFEVESFDPAVATVAKIAEEEQGFVATVNSEKLPNGKVRGSVVVRVAPERLDTLLLKLRALGELKSQRIGSQDVTKQYYDLESRLRAARTMEERLLKIIKEGKGEIKDLLQAEKELGEWRTKIESFEGEIRYYNAMISLSTLTLTLQEREIKAPTGIVETERVQAGLEVEDVEKAHKDVLAAVNEAKGRVTKSELKQLAAGQFNAVVHFEVAPDASGPLRDRLRQLGTLARLEVDRLQEVEGGVGKAAGVNVRKKDSIFLLSIYNLANVQPRETLVMSLACPDAEASYKAILARVEKAGGRVITSSLNRQKNEQTTGTIHFEVKSAEAEAVLSDLRAAGEVMRLDLNENPDAQNVTRAKRGHQVQLFAMGLVAPRETATISLAARDVAAAHKALEEAARKAKARILQSYLNEQDRQRINATLDVELRREDAAVFEAALRSAGEVLSRSARRAEDQERVVDSKLRATITMMSASVLVPRETYTATVEAKVVDSAVKLLEAAAVEAGGRVSDSSHTRGADGRNSSRMTLEIPLGKAKGVADKLRDLGEVRAFEVGRNPAAPEGELATARLMVTISDRELLVTPDSGPWSRIRQGLSISLTALSWSLSLVVVGLCFILPLALVGWGGNRIYRKLKRSPV